jgi:NADPH:quinone reductase-like Zn-dependent oxidoreductase
MSTPLMKAIRVHAYGGPDQLILEEIPRPEPQADEILVRIHAAGVLPMETAVRQGMYPGIMPKAFPYTPGTAFAGVVEEVGPGVTTFSKGQAICGRAPTGTYAEYVTININPPAYVPGQDRARLTAAVIPLADKPKTLSFDEAATLSGGATTAWTSIFDDGGVQAGQRVLIHGAAGGVGLFAVQFAKWKGAEVIATTSTPNVDYVRSIGADTVIDYRATRFEDAAHDVDFVLDTIGGDTQIRSMRLLKRGGTLISVYEVPPADLADELGIRAMMNQTLPNNQHLRQIVQLIDEGCASPAIRQVFPLRDANKAHALSETGHGRGRIVLHVAD